MKYIVGVSGGKDSTALALRLKELHPEVDYEYLITPVGNELEEMEAHWRKLEGILGKPFVRLKPFTEGDGLLHLIEHYNALPNFRQRWCTRQLKIEPTIAYLVVNAPAVQYVGLRADEEERGGIYGDIPGVTQSCPFREWGWGVEDVWGYLAERGIKVPRRTDCAWCFGQRLIEWRRLWQEHPEVYEKAVQLEKATSHTFRSKARDTWPAALDELRQEFENGRLMKGDKPLPRPGCKQLELWESPEPEERACRVCSL